MNALTQAALRTVEHPDFARLFLDTTLKSVVVLLAVGGLCLFWRRASAATRHLIWFLAILTLPVLPLVSLAVPSWNRPLWSVSTGVISGNRIALALEFAPGAQPETLAPQNRSAPAQPGMTGSKDARTASGGRLATDFNADWLVFAFAAWLGGAILALISWGIGYGGIRKLARNARPMPEASWALLLSQIRAELGLRRPVTLLQSFHETMPVTWGWLRPVVLLPVDSAQWPEERRRMVLAHELAHVKRWDCLTQTVARVIGSLWWFHPLVWLAARRMRVERERACDDRILAGGWKASDYAEHLLDIARSFRRVPQLTAIAMARSPGLQQRVLAILDSHRNRNCVEKGTVAVLALAFLGLGLSLGGWAKAETGNPSAPWSFEHSEVAGPLKRFVAEKRAQAAAALEAQGKEMLPEFNAMFAAAAKGDWPAINRIWSDLRERAPQYEGRGPKDERLHGTAWQTMLEIWGAFGNIAAAEKEVVAFGRDAIASIPPGSIYFGGTDPGRCVITALQKSQVQAEPFFTLTQNALADGSYLRYLRDMYAAKIYIPTDEDSKRCFDDYVADAGRRFKTKELKPGEDVKEVDGKVQVRGQVAVMAINALLAKIIFDKNPDHEFYVEESFPLDWMYPHLSPNGPIMKINRQPLNELPEETVRQDRAYWTGAVKPMIGEWLHPDTPLQTVVEFAQRVSMPPASDDPRDPQADSGKKWASKLRSSIAGLYTWRLEHAAVASDKTRLTGEADFAFRQALALCPYSPEAVYRYVNFLVKQQRVSDALLVAKTAAHVDNWNDQLPGLIRQLERMQKTP
jgi:beta-lactamase regulating signal transducer with metallopeptidase domain